METIRSLLDIYEFTPGRILFSVQLTKEAAQQNGHTEVVVACDAAIAAAQHWLEVSAAWERTKNAPKARGDGDAAALDPLLDRAVAGCHSIADSYGRVLPTEHPLAVRARDLIRKAFPGGPGAITNLAFEEELAAIKTLLARFRDAGDLAPHVAELGLTPIVAELMERSGQFEAALRKASAAEITFGKVKQADSEAQECLAELIGKLVGTFNTRSPDHVKARQLLLGPIMEQDARIGDARKRRRPVTDVDPKTGAAQPMSPAASTEPAPPQL